MLVGKDKYYNLQYKPCPIQAYQILTYLII